MARVFTQSAVGGAAGLVPSKLLTHHPGEAGPGVGEVGAAEHRGAVGAFSLAQAVLFTQGLAQQQADVRVAGV